MEVARARAMSVIRSATYQAARPQPVFSDCVINNYPVVLSQVRAMGVRMPVMYPSTEAEKKEIVYMAVDMIRYCLGLVDETPFWQYQVDSAGPGAYLNNPVIASYPRDLNFGVFIKNALGMTVAMREPAPGFGAPITGANGFTSVAPVGVYVQQTGTNTVQVIFSGAAGGNALPFVNLPPTVLRVETHMSVLPFLYCGATSMMLEVDVAPVVTAGDIPVNPNVTYIFNRDTIVTAVRRRTCVLIFSMHHAFTTRIGTEREMYPGYSEDLREVMDAAAGALDTVISAAMLNVNVPDVLQLPESLEIRGQVEFLWTIRLLALVIRLGYALGLLQRRRPGAPE